MSPTIGGALQTSRAALSEFLPSHEADREARLIVGRVTGRSQASLIADPNAPLDGEQDRRLKEILEARQARQPLSQILREVEFYGRAFEVTQDVLTPRSDTETLIDIALSEPFTRVLDLGTGSGCILTTLLSERPGATGVGTDVSQPALDIAARNLARHGAGDRATLILSDWFERVEGQFDLIVSNPPYIAETEMPELAPEVREWEPHLALTPGGDGLAAYRAITQAAQAHLTPGGRLLVEIGYAQGPAVYRIFDDAGLDPVLLHTDINGHDRVVGGHRP